MRKHFFCIICSIILFGLVGCSQQNQGNQVTDKYYVCSSGSSWAGTVLLFSTDATVEGVSGDTKIYATYEIKDNAITLSYGKEEYSGAIRDQGERIIIGDNEFKVTEATELQEGTLYMFDAVRNAQVISDFEKAKDITFNGVTLSIPEEWDYSMDETGIYFDPADDTFVFYFGDMNINQKFNLSSDSHAKSVANAMFDWAKSFGDSGVLKEYYVRKENIASEERDVLCINFYITVSEKTCNGKILCFFVEDKLYGLVLIESNEGELRYGDDTYVLIRTIR